LGAAHLAGIDSWAFEAAEDALASPVPFRLESVFRYPLPRSSRLESRCANSTIETALPREESFHSYFRFHVDRGRDSEDIASFSTAIVHLASQLTRSIDRVVILLLRRSPSGSETLFASTQEINNAIIESNFEIRAPERTLQAGDELELRVCLLKGSEVVSVFKKTARTR
jgi:hypothetical protein